MPAPISVVIPARNAADTIGRALVSVARQTCRPAEIILVDDASTDDTAQCAAAAGLPDLRLIRHDQRGGAAAARNAGIAAASGEYIAFLDADDEWADTKLEKQLAVIADAPAMAFVACRSVLIDPVGQENRPIHATSPVVTGPEAWRALLAANFVSTPCVMARRATVLAVGGFDPRLPIAEDQDLWIRLALAGAVGFVDEVLVRVHYRRNSISQELIGREIEFTLPMLLGHVARNRDRLSASEVRRILGRRYSQIGRTAYLNGCPGSGFTLVAKAILMGAQPVENSWHLITASPPSRFLKRLIGRREPAW